MDSMRSCPVCNLRFPSSELQRHANSHFDDEYDSEKDERLAMDFELAQELALAESNSLASSTSMWREGNQSMDDHDVSCLVGVQTRSSFYQVKGTGGLIAMLQRCLEFDPERGTSVTLLSGYVDHYQSLPWEDRGWGCGWRNVQMLGSHLLSCRQDISGVLFGGCGFVPDIPALQVWLESAWQKGFDVDGSMHFNKSVYGSKKWIGATECAALFRSFGLRASIVDFSPKELQSLSLSVPGTSLGSQNMWANTRGKRKAFQVHGPMDRFLGGGHRDSPKSNFRDKSGCGTNDWACGSYPTRENRFSRTEGHQVLLDWVWNYFSPEPLTASADRQHVVLTEKPPLYFQHDGHSRTIVGIQVRRQKNGKQQYDLLILDPGQRTEALERSLKQNVGWKNLIKRGAHTLKKPQYQLCYVEPGIASGQELERLKTIDSVFIESNSRR